MSARGRRESETFTLPICSTAYLGLLYLRFSRIYIVFLTKNRGVSANDEDLRGDGGGETPIATWNL